MPSSCCRDTCRERGVVAAEGSVTDHGRSQLSMRARQGFPGLARGDLCPPSRVIYTGRPLALMTRLKRPGMRILFLARRETAHHTEGVGDILKTPVPAADVVAKARNAAHTRLNDSTKVARCDAELLEV